MQNQHPKHSGILIFLSGLGFLDAFFLSYEHFMKLIPPCTPGFQCDLVTTSAYSVILGVPVPYLGLVYYVALFIGAFLYFEHKKLSTLKILRLLSGLGFLGSLYFTYIQGWVLNAWCLYCIASAIITTLFHITCHFENKRLTGSFI